MSEHFFFSVETLQNGQIIRSEDLPLTVRGRYNSADPIRARVVLQEHISHGGRYYLQNPPVAFLPNNRWVAKNIQPGPGIESIHFVRVDEQADAHFSQMVDRRHWAPFDKLPPGSTILYTVRILRETTPQPVEEALPETEPIFSDIDFTIETLEPGQLVRDQDLPLTIEGRYATQDRVQAWVVLQDLYRDNYYLQSPEVDFLPNGRWVAQNILPGMEIRFIHFVRVNDKGQAHFQRKVENGEWGAFQKLPPGSTILHSIDIRRE